MKKDKKGSKLPGLFEACSLHARGQAGPPDLLYLVETSAGVAGTGRR